MFDNATAFRGLSMPTSGSLSCSSDAIGWQSCGVDGFWLKPLFEDDSSAQKCWLMKMDAGAYSSAHAHENIEQIFVLDGSFYDDDKIHQKGDYIIRAPGAMHTAGSEEGALMLLVYTNAE